MTYVQRDIDLTIQLGTGSFGDGPYNTVKLSGLRISASIGVLGMPSLNQAQIRIYGMALSQMNQLAQIGFLQNAVRNNIVTLSAGDAKAGMSIAFAGGIRYAWSDLQGAPDVTFNISAFTSMLAALKPVPPSSFQGRADVGVIMGALATQMGLTLENSGVDVQLSNPYFPGTALAQVQAVAKAANIYAFIDRDGGKLVIIPKNGVRGGAIPLVSAATGMVGYPVYSGPGRVLLKTLFNPAIQVFGHVNVQSTITAANGLWRVNKMTHILESQMPDGAWFTEIEASLFDRKAAAA